MYKSRLIYLAIAIVAFVFSQSLYESVSFMTLIIVLILPLLSITLAFLSYPLIRIKTAVSKSDLLRFDEFILRISIMCGSPFLSPSFRVTCSVPDAEGVRIEPVVFVLNSPCGRRGHFDYKCFFANRGQYDVTVDSVELYDFLKLIKLKKIMDKRVSVNVGPRDIKLLLPVNSTQHTQENTNIVGTTESVNSGDILGVREYSFGDNLRNVHWKLSSKADDLVMKTFAEDIYDQAYVITDMSAYYTDIYQNRAMTDCVVEVTLSVIREYARRSVRFSLLMNVGKSDTERYPISTDEEMLYARHAVSAARYVEGTDIIDLLRGLDFKMMAGCDICIITSFRSRDVLKSVKKLFVGKNCKLSVVDITDVDTTEEDGVITYNRKFIENRSSKQ